MNDILIHYSYLIWKVRSFTIVQTFVIFSAIGYIINDSKIDDINAQILSILGAVFSFLLLKLQLNYIKDFKTHLDAAKKCKTRDYNTWIYYAENYYKTGKFKKFIIEFGIFALLTLSFVISYCLI